MNASRPDRHRAPHQLLASIHKKCLNWRWQEGEPEQARVWPWYRASVAAAADVKPLLDATPARRKARRHHD
jgi:hypothetical protein